MDSLGFFLSASFALRGCICVIDCAVLKNCAKWVMMVGVFVALSLRAIGFGHLHEEIGSKCRHSVAMCQESQLDSGLPSDDLQNDRDCPLNHDHHSCCTTALPLAVDSSFICRLRDPGSILLGVRHEGELPADEPFLVSEKPPLI